MSTKKGIIYKATCVTNGKSYIGKTIADFEWYKEQHLRAAMGLVDRGTRLFYKAVRKFGPENFEWTILEEAPIELLNDLEKHYIEMFKTYIGFEDCRGYNMTPGGDGGNTYSEFNRDRFAVGWEKNRGKTRSPQVRENISTAAKKRWADEEERQRQSIRKKGKNTGEACPASQMFKIISPDGEESVITGLLSFCKEQDFPYTTVMSWVNKGKVSFARKLKNPRTMRCVGWEFVRLTSPS